jgi:hypothetical protein
VISGVLAVLSFAANYRDNILPPEKRAAWDTYVLLPHWPASWWLVLALLVLVFGLLEASYRQTTQLRDQLRAPPRVVQASVDELARLRVIGVGLLNEGIHTSEHMQDWVAREAAWRTSVIEHLRRELTTSAVYRFEHPGPERQSEVRYDYGEGHRLMRGALEQRLEILQEIVTAYEQR